MDWENLKVIAGTVLAIGVFIHVVSFLFSVILWLFRVGSKKLKSKFYKRRGK